MARAPTLSVLFALVMLGCGPAKLTPDDFEGPRYTLTGDGDRLYLAATKPSASTEISSYSLNGELLWMIEDEFPGLSSITTTALARSGNRIYLSTNGVLEGSKGDPSTSIEEYTLLGGGTACSTAMKMSSLGSMTALLDGSLALSGVSAVDEGMSPVIRLIEP